MGRAVEATKAFVIARSNRFFCCDPPPCLSHLGLNNPLLFVFVLNTHTHTHSRNCGGVEKKRTLAMPVEDPSNTLESKGFAHHHKSGRTVPFPRICAFLVWIFGVLVVVVAPTVIVFSSHTFVPIRTVHQNFRSHQDFPLEL